LCDEFRCVNIRIPTLAAATTTEETIHPTPGVSTTTSVLPRRMPCIGCFKAFLTVSIVHFPALLVA
jgi:hypothetical protein